MTIERGFIANSPGSVLFRAGATAVLVTAQLSESVPPFLEGKGVGWLTAEYAMLPGSTPGRKRRGTDGRATEIQRLIGRSLRAVVDTRALGPWTIHVDADVINADGGTRTAAITAAFLAVADAVRHQFSDQARSILRDSVAAVSAGIRGRRAAAGPELSRRLPGGSRSQCRPAGPWRVGRGARNRRRRRVFPRSAPRAAGPGGVGIDRLGRLQREAMGAEWIWE